jgi:outer membrane autotransporter protein
VLYSRPTDIVNFTPLFGTAALTAYHSSFDPLADRQHALADAVGSNDATALGLKDGPVARTGTFGNVWATPFGSHRDENTSSASQVFFGKSFSDRLDYGQSTYGLQGGFDLVSISESGDAVMAGVFGGFLNSLVSADGVPVSGKFEGGTFGVYGSYLNGGFSLSASLKADLLNFDWKAPSLNLDASADVKTFGGRVEAAYKHVVGGHSWMEPYANLTYAQSHWDEFTVLATTFDIDDNQSLLGRAGLRVGTDVHNSTSQLIKVFAGVGVVYEFDGDNTAGISSGGNTLSLTHQVDTTSLELQGGFKLQDIDTGLSLSVTSNGKVSEDAEEYGGRATLNYKF